MIVYRYLGEDELKKILSENTESLGNSFQTNKDKQLNKNTHHYKPDEKYMHFFKKETSMQMMSYLYRKANGNFYFCSFDIPIKALLFHSGKGFYISSGYDGPDSLKEYAIPVSQFKPEYLESYTLDKTRNSLELHEVLDKIY